MSNELLSAAKIRTMAICDAGAYQDDETGEWSFYDEELQLFAKAIRKAALEEQAQRITELEKELEEARPKWKVCPSCMGRGKRDVAHGVTAPCKECSGAKVLAVEPQTNRA